MYRVISQDFIGNHALLEVNKELPKKKYHKYLIDGKEYDCVPVYDLPNHIAINSDEGFIGKKVEFI